MSFLFAVTTFVINEIILCLLTPELGLVSLNCTLIFTEMSGCNYKIKTFFLFNYTIIHGHLYNRASTTTLGRVTCLFVH